MVAEWRLNVDGKSGFQSHFGRYSETIQSPKLQAHFRDLLIIYLLIFKMTPNANRTRDLRIPTRGPLISRIEIWFTRPKAVGHGYVCSIGGGTIGEWLKLVPFL